jgi:hypothetical protein
MNRYITNGGNIDSQTVLHIPMHGEDNGTVFWDASPNHAVVSRVTGSDSTNVITDTDQSIFKGSSAYFPNTTTYQASPGYGCLLTVPDSANWVLGTGLFTIDFWARMGDTSQWAYGVFSQYTPAGGNNYWIICRLYGTGYLRMTYNWGDITSADISLTGYSFVASTWYHIAIIRGWGGNANDFIMTVNGTGITPAITNSSFNWQDYTSALRIGSAYVDNNWNYGWYGWLSNFRITKGIARWTSNFSISKPPGRGLVS